MQPEPWRQGSHSWINSVSELATPDELAAEGMTGELLGPVSACVDPDEPFVEYGIVEYRLRQRYPDLFLAHVRDRGHVILGPKAYTALERSVRSGSWTARSSWWTRQQVRPSNACLAIQQPDHLLGTPTRFRSSDAHVG